MKKILLLVFMAISGMMSSEAITIVPVTSTTGNDVWYMIKCNPRNPANIKETWLSVTPLDSMTYSVYTGGDEQFWKVVENGTGVALVNKKTGFYVDADNRRVNSLRTRITTKVTIPATPLRLVPSSAYTGLSWPGWDGKTPGIFILDNTGATTVTATNEITVNLPDEGFALSIYSPVSGTFIVANQPGWVHNLNQVVLFRTARDILEESISMATTGYNNSSEGLNPGQYTSDDLDALFGTIEAAQEVLDNTASTDNQKITAAFELDAIFLQFKAQVILPELSNDNSEVWYYIQGTRPANTYMTAPAAGAGTQVKNSLVIPDDTQLWKLVSNGDGFALQNKASQEYLQTDFPSGTNLNTQTDMPIKALRFITSNETSNKAYRFWIENTTSFTEAFRLHAGGSGLMNWTGDPNDNCSWLFLSEDEVFRVELTNTRLAAQNLYNASVEGDEFGQFSASTRAAFNTALTTEGAKNMATMTQEELKASNQALKDAMAALECNREVSTLSSVTKKKWFRLVSNSTATYASGKAISSNGRTVDQKFTYENKDATSDAQLFTFELNEDGTNAISIVNKANGLFMGTDGAMVATAPETEFEITPLDNISFWIKPTGVAPLHAAAVNVEILNWDAPAGSSSAWRFEYVSSENITDFKEAYLIKRMQMRTKVDMAKEVTGAEIGQYTTASVAAFETIIAAEETKNTDDLTQDQMRDAILAMNAASTGLVINTDINLLVSTTAGMYKWFRVINNMAGTGYASGKAMSSNGRLKGEQFTYEDKDINSDAQLFRFELTPDQTQVASMINKGSGMYVSAEGLLDSVSTADNNFEIIQLAGGRSFWIDPTLAETDPLHAAADGIHIVNWLADAGSASAWIFEFAGETTDVKNLLPFTNKIRTANGIITIDGVENFEVYSITGQKQNHKQRLMTGVYIVKVNNSVQKVVLK